MLLSLSLSLSLFLACSIALSLSLSLSLSVFLSLFSRSRSLSRGVGRVCPSRVRPILCNLVGLGIKLQFLFSATASERGENHLKGFTYFCLRNCSSQGQNKIMFSTKSCLDGGKTCWHSSRRVMIHIMLTHHSHQSLRHQIMKQESLDQGTNHATIITEIQ